MSLPVDKIVESKGALRRELASRPIAEKLRVLDALRERAIAIRGTTHSIPASQAIREETAFNGSKSRMTKTAAMSDTHPLVDLVQPRREKARPSEHSDLCYVGLEHIEAHTTRLIGSVHAIEMRSTANRFKPGDVLYSRLRPYLNKVWRADREGLCSSEFIVIPGNDRIDADFLRYRLNAPDFVSFANQLNAGDRPRVDFDQISAFEIWLPGTLTEQRRIVAEIEKQFTRLDAGAASLKRVRVNLKRYRAVVLNAACEGRLVPIEAELQRVTSRRESAPGFENGAQVLARILSVRRKCWRGGREYREPAGPDLRALPILPEGWTWARMQQVGEIQLGRQRAPQHHAGDNMRPYLRVANVFEARLELTDVKWMNFTPEEFEKYRLRFGDILLNEGQTPELVGRPALYRGEIENCCYQKTLLRFRAYDGLLPAFALTVFRSYMHNGRFTRAASITTNIAHLTAEKFVEIEVPLPSVAEQKRIVAEVERRFSLIDELEVVVETKLQRAKSLRQSILQRAFAGNT